MPHPSFARPILLRAGHRGFTLIEILIVVIILGVLAAIVIPLFTDSAEDAERVAFTTSLHRFGSSAQRYMLDTGTYLEDSSSGVMPSGFGPYISDSSWTGGTPIGGVWDFELNSFGITSGFGVHFDGTGETRDDAYMTTIDDLFDDGVLTTGRFQKLAADRYYYVLVP